MNITIDAQLSHTLCLEVVATETYLINISPSRSNQEMSPMEKYIGKPIDLSRLKVFGCADNVYVKKPERSKLDAQAKLCIFVDYDCQTKGYRIYAPEKQKIFVTIDMQFDEQTMAILLL